jgi:hypothetical protein
MKRLMFAAAMLAAACSEPPVSKQAPPQPEAPMADAAGNRMEALTETDGRWCSGDGVWCVVQEAPGARVVRAGSEEPIGVLPLGDTETNRIWPMIVRTRADDVVLLGVVRRVETMYSGGGGSAEHLHLVQIGDPNGQTTVFEDIPLSGSLMIRACFDEDDQTARRDACHDEYEFASTLTLDQSVAEGRPTLVVTSEATTYPGQRSRSSDSTQAPALQASDLVRWRDETCSYRRVASWRGDAYVWDEPFPACTDYLEP